MEAAINCSLSICLIGHVIKSLVEIEPELMAELQKLAPELPDKLLHSTTLAGSTINHMTRLSLLQMWKDPEQRRSLVNKQLIRQW